MHIDRARSALVAETSIFIRMTSVTRLTGLGRSTIYRLVAQRRFPSPVRLTSHAVAWRLADVERWSEERPSVCQSLVARREHQ
jgi:prophage regulatory protein